MIKLSTPLTFVQQIILLIVLSAGTTAKADESIIKSQDFQVPVSSIHKIVNIVDKQEDNSPNRQQLSIIVQSINAPNSTDPRQKIYLSYFRGNGLASLSSSFLVSAQATKFESAQRVGPGLYEVITQEVVNKKFIKTKYSIDASQIFIDEENSLKWANDELFIMGPLSTTIKINRQVTGN